MNRPPLSPARSQAMCAVVVGLRVKARAIAVPRPTRVVAAAARASGKYGSWLVSFVQSASKPIVSAARAVAATASRLGPADPAGSLMSSQASKNMPHLLVR